MDLHCTPLVRVLVCCGLFATASADANTRRSHKVIAEFKRAQPCPATGQPRGRCPGYVIDHVIPICAGGPDAVTNLQWQTVADGKAKDRLEAAQCLRR